MTLFRKDLLGIEPYRPVEVKDAIRLDRNESPFDLPLQVKEEIINAFSSLRLNHYPDAWCGSVKEAFSQYVGKIKPEEVTVGNGCDEVIQNVIMAFALNNGPVLSFWPTFHTYQIASRNLGIEYIEIPLNEDFTMPIEKVIDVVKEKRPSVIVICNPNNPTGNCFPDEYIENIINSTPGIVLIDEVYCEFSKKSFVDKFRLYPNVLILRTLSKAFSGAGVRMGFAFGNKFLIDEVEKVRLPYLLSHFSQVAGSIILKNSSLFKSNIDAINAEINRIYDGLLKMGIRVYPTEANFLLAKFDKPTKDIVEKLRKRKILVRFFPYLPNFIRISAGRSSDTNILLKELSRILNE
ncbi:Histidinol-phosphate aminotransferase [Thermodesulfobium narugense DSM 14796]|uniref:Histidinol-phosphate aminotransferase n=1 Tax=Thermodesulfobium narugense DSM 14796 TaxID=747365 RepID=M1E4K6_9BACT|nr:histidinol-phosphate transaminase [Thermodesulfobium narugense]AEE14252.1 Histidinol-phosphate aminotransferase [Thermodesulfobium narugense DSM 14796]